jgi:hypothetical protein
VAPESAFHSKLALIWSGDDEMELALAFPADSTTLDVSGSLLVLLAVCFFVVHALRACVRAAASLRHSDDL